MREPTGTQALTDLRVHAESDKDRLRSNIAMKALWFVCLAFLAVIALVSVSLGEMPWNVRWAEGGSLSGLVLESVSKLRYELAGLLLVVLSFLLLLARQAVNNVRFNDSFNNPDSFVDWEAVEKNSDEDMSDEFDDQAQRTLIDDLGVEMAEQERSQQTTGMDVEMFREGFNRTQCPEQSNAQLRIATDELSRVRRELVACRQQLELVDHAKSQFLDTMSYELRTPISGIAGMADLLLSGDLSQRDQRCASSILSSSTMLLTTIDNLLDISKIESGVLALENAPFSIKNCVEHVCATLTGNAQAKEVVLTCYVDEAMPSQVDGDASRIRQILHNLIANAVAATEQGEIVVRLKRNTTSNGKSFYQCDVQDTGVGISPEMQVQLFDALSQDDSSTIHANAELGAGLAMSHALVSMMNGEITFRSRLGEGTRFSVTMELDDVDQNVDLVPMHESTSCNDDKLDVQPASRNARVLLVEDNQVNQSVATSMLEQLGCDVALAEDGVLAVQMGGQKKYDIVLMDCQMPNMDGYEATRLIKSGGSLNSPTPIVALTANAMAGDREKCLLAGMDDYVSKPVRTQALSHVLQKWVGLENKQGTSTVRELSHEQSSTEAQRNISAGLISVDIDVGVVDLSLSSEVISSELYDATMDLSPENDDVSMVEDAVLSNDAAVSDDTLSVQMGSINLKAIDVIRGLQRVGKDDLLTKVVHVYFDKTPELIDTMEDAAENADFESLSACAHSLKSSSAYLGADLVSKTCRLIESAIKDEDGEEAKKLVAAIRSEYKRVSGALNSLVKAA